MTDDTNLVTTVNRLLRKPIEQLTAEDCRVLITQQVRPDDVVPRAIALLEADPLASGDYYPGDLLVAVSRLPAEFWNSSRGEASRVEAVLRSVRATPDDDGRNVPWEVLENAMRAFEERC